MNYVWYDTVSDQIRVSTGVRSEDYAALSLVASSADGKVAIRLRNTTSNIISAPFNEFSDEQGNAFASEAALITYLTCEFFKVRALGTAFGTEAVAGADLAQGMPLTVSRVTGQLLPARADIYTLSFVTGLAPFAVAQGFTTTPLRGAFTLTDWSAITGEAVLHPGAPYFLDETGGLTISPFFPTGMTVTRVGLAASATTLTVDPTDPILL